MEETNPDTCKHNRSVFIAAGFHGKEGKKKEPDLASGFCGPT